MSYSKEPMEVAEKMRTKEVDARPPKKRDEEDGTYKWWLAQSDAELCNQLLSTTNFLKKAHALRIRQASIYTRLFSGKPLYNYLANTSSLDSSQQLPMGRPTANVVYSCTDTLVSRISQDRPRPVFLTDNGHYKERKLAEQYNSFIMGEFHREKAYEKGAVALKDACVLGNGFIKVLKRDKKVRLERTLETELLVDFNDAYYNDPRSLIQMKLVDRGTFLALFPEKEDLVLKAQHGNVDNTPLSTLTSTDQFIISEGWHLPSSSESNDGRHVIACSAGVLLDEPWKKSKFPFVKLSYNENMVGWFAQGLAEILMPTQMEIYKLLIIASQSIELMGVPRIFIDEMSKVLETAFNNNIGTMIKYRNNKPTFETAPCNAPEIYEWIKWLIQNAFQMSGISGMSASSQKPAGLNSGEAIRSFDDLQTDRFANLSRKYSTVYPELAYMMIEEAAEIAEEEGSYTSVYPNKDGTRVVDLPAAKMLKESYIIECFDESALPRDPAGRQAKLSEMLAAQEITQQEFRRLSRLPDLEQSDRLANALEERILQNLDAIVDKGEKGFNPPDQFILDPTDLATTLTVQYINEYSVANLEESKMQLLRDYFTQIQNIKQMATPPVPMPQPPQPGQGTPAVVPPSPSVAPTSGAHV